MPMSCRQQKMSRRAMMCSSTSSSAFSSSSSALGFILGLRRPRIWRKYSLKSWLRCFPYSPLQRRRCNKAEQVSSICTISVLPPTDQYHVGTETYLKKLFGRTDIEDALKKLDELTREEVQLAIAQILKATKELKSGVHTHGFVTNLPLNVPPLRCHEIQRRCRTDGERGGRNKGRLGRYDGRYE